MESGNNVSYLEQLRELINNVSRSKSTTEVLQKSLIDLTESTVFGFQFSVINLINPFTQTVTAWLPSPRCYPDLKHEEWRNKEEDLAILKLPENDIILVVSKNSCILKVVADTIEFLEGSATEKPVLDSRLYKRWRHDRLTRIFMPLLDTTSDQDRLTYGVIEMGFVTADYHLTISSELVTRIKLYIDNCVQVYYKAYVEETTRKLEKAIKTLRNIRDHQNFLKRVTEVLIRHFDCDAAEISVISLDEAEEEWTPHKTESKSSGFEQGPMNAQKAGNPFKAFLSERFAIHREVFKEQQPIYCPGPSSGCLALRQAEGWSQFSVPFSHNDKYVGVLSLYATQPNYFDKLRRDSVINISPLICDMYIRKKTHYLLSKLVLPLNIFGDPDEMFKSSMQIIQEYFVGGKIKIVIEKNRRDEPSYQYELDEGRNFLVKELSSVRKWNSAAELEVRREGDKVSITSTLFIGQKKKKVYGYIQIEANRQIEVSEDDKIFLSQSSSKLSTTLNLIDLFQVIFSMPTSLATGKVEEVYQKIEASAKNIFGAKPVTLSQIVNNNKFSVLRLTGSNDLIHFINDKEAEGDQNDPSMIGEVIRCKEIYVKDKDEYFNFWSADRRGWKPGHFKNDFYEREEIVSFAAILLEYNKEPLGALFLNYRDTSYVSGFDEDFKSQLKTFGFLASQAIAYAKLLEENTSFRIKNFRANKPLIDSLVLLGLIHGIENETRATKDGLTDLLKNLQKRKMPDEVKKWLLEELSAVSDPLNELYSSVERFRSFRNTKAEKPIFVDKSLSEIIGETLPLVRNKLDLEKISIDWKQHSKDVVIYVDVNSVKNILINFLYNAIEAITDAKSWRRKEIRVEHEVKGGMAVIKVSDSGPGIAPEVYAQLFTPYVTTKKYGTGMGLSICKYLAEVNGGKIEVDEKPNEKGGSWTTFYLLLPLEKNKPV